MNTNENSDISVNEAVKSNHTIDDFISKNGVDCMVRSNSGIGSITLLMAACIDGDLDAVNYLISKNANINLEIHNGIFNDTALSYSINNMQIMLRLIECGADPYYKFINKKKGSLFENCNESTQELISRKMIEMKGTQLIDSHDNQNDRSHRKNSL